MKNIQADIKSGNFKQVYLLYGEEAYLKQQYKQNLVKALNPDGDTMNFNHYEGKGIDVKQLIDLCETMPFFAERRVVLLEDTGFFKNKCEELADYMKELPDYLYLVFAETEVDKRNRMYKAVKACGSIAEFIRQDEKTLMRWAAGLLGKAGKKIPVEVINNVTGERYSINLTLAYDGEFGFKAVLTVNMEAKNAGLYANLFYYNGQSGELEFVCAGEIDAEGNVDLTFTHASDYTIVIDVQSMAKAEEPTVSESSESTEKPSGTESLKEDIASQADAEAKSASPLWFVLIGCAVAIAAAGIILFVKKKNRE